VKLRVNGGEQELAAGTTLVQLVRELTGGTQNGIAVALDGEVVPRQRWEGTTLADGQVVEVLHAVQGG